MICWHSRAMGWQPTRRINLLGAETTALTRNSERKKGACTPRSNQERSVANSQLPAFKHGPSNLAVKHPIHAGAELTISHGIMITAKCPEVVLRKSQRTNRIKCQTVRTTSMRYLDARSDCRIVEKICTLAKSLRSCSKNCGANHSHRN